MSFAAIAHGYLDRGCAVRSATRHPAALELRLEHIHEETGTIRMNQSEQKIVQYLNEAHALEQSLTQVLRSQIAMTPEGSYRAGLEKHLRETEKHAERVRARVGELESAGNPFLAGLAFVEDAVGQMLALWKAPLDMMRGTSVEEKVLKNAKDSCAAEALEIATYTALEELAKAAGDEVTAQLAASIRADEERMLARITRELPKLARAVAGAERSHEAVTDAVTDAVQSPPAVAVREGRKAARAATAVVEKAAESVPAADELPISGYDTLTADDIAGKLAGLSQRDLAKVDAYERANGDRSTVRARIDALRGEEPWAGYDELTVADIRAALAEGDSDERADAVRSYERAHKNRAGVLDAVARETAAA
jgi:ferritin-like metal-binding protein YciE